MTEKEFISHLIEKNGFKRIAPNTLLYQDNVDVITVFVGDESIIILADGPEVISSTNFIDCDSELDWEDILQLVLSKF